MLFSRVTAALGGVGYGVTICAESKGEEEREREREGAAPIDHSDVTPSFPRYSLLLLRVCVRARERVCVREYNTHIVYG